MIFDTKIEEEEEKKTNIASMNDNIIVQRKHLHLITFTNMSYENTSDLHSFAIKHSKYHSPFLFCQNFDTKEIYFARLQSYSMVIISVPYL